MHSMSAKFVTKQSASYRALSVAVLATGLLFAAQANAGPHRAVSSEVLGSDSEGLGGAEFAPFVGSLPFDAGGTVGDEALFGAGAFEGKTISDEAELLTEGVELAGFDGEVGEEELEHLLTLPAVGGNGGQEVLLGSDTRSRLYTTSYPARAVVLITFTGGRCSGFMIGNNTVATAGHCVHSGGSGGAWRANVRVYPGYNQSTAPYGSCTARRLYSVTGWTSSRNPDYDYGAIKLNCTVGNSTGWFGFRSNAGNNTPSIITGYPGDKPLQMWQSADKIRGTTTRQLFYTNDTVGGMSGSAVWEDFWSSNVSRGPYAIAIHAYGPYGSGLRGTYNHGTRITSAVFSNLLNWKNAR